MKKCPYCAEEIQDDAIKCRYCNEWLNKTETDGSPSTISTKPIAKKATEPSQRLDIKQDEKDSISIPVSKKEYNIITKIAVRSGAFTIDMILCLIVGVIIERLASGLFGTIIAIIPICLYFSLLESSYKQATLGKMAMGLIVTDLNGNRISFILAISRFFLKFGHLLFVIILSGWMKNLYYNSTYRSGAGGFLYGLFCCLLILSFIAPILLSKKRQAIHDIIAQTMVIKNFHHIT